MGINEFENFEYSEKELKILRDINLTEDELKMINKLKNTFLKKKFKKWAMVIEDIYKLYTYGYMPEELCIIYGKKTRQVQTLIKECGFSRGLKESSIISAQRGRKDFGEISKKGRLTLSKNGNVSKPEEYTRKLLNEYLALELPNSQVVVGVNNRSILSGKEIDIPIVIINYGNVYLYGVEFNGDYWHKDTNDSDEIKIKMANELGYKMFTITQECNVGEAKLKEYILNEVKTIADYIKKDID